MAEQVGGCFDGFPVVCWCTLMTELACVSVGYGVRDAEWACVFLHKKKASGFLEAFCDPAAIRTQDLLLRRQLLYPAELRGHRGF